MLLPEDLCNRSPSFGALVIREETPSSLPVGCPADGLTELIRQHCLTVAPGYRLIFLLPAAGGPAFPDGPLRLGVPHQARVDTPLPEFHPQRDHGPDLSGPADAQRLC